MDARAEALLDAAARRYAGADRYFRHFARHKLRLDPVFAALLRHEWLPRRGTLLDLGCGQGLLLALLDTAGERGAGGEWPPGWPAPPRLELHGIDCDARRAQAARQALDGRARVTQGDIREAAFTPCDAVVVLDVLLYLEPAQQQRVLERAAAALVPGGVLLLREADAGAGLAFRMTRWSERLLEIARGRWRNRLHYRRAGEWRALLESLGFAVTAEPMSAGTPFANRLFVARKP